MNFRPGLPFGLCKICFRQDIHLNIFIGHFTYHECQFYMIAGIWTIYFIITEISLMIHVTPFYNGTGLDWCCIWLFFINIISFCEQFSLCSLILGSPESQRWTTVMCLDKSLTLNEQCQFFFRGLVWIYHKSALEEESKHYGIWNWQESMVVALLVKQQFM